MATPNYGYEKRQRELAKKKKKEDKLRAKSAPQRPDAYTARPPDGTPPDDAPVPSGAGGESGQPG